MRRRFKTAAASADWHHRTSTALADGAFVARSSLTVRQACEAWLRAKELRTKPTTAAAYSAALAPVIQRYGRMPVQSITRSDVETLIAELVAGSAGRVPWKRTSINPMLARWRSVWSGLHADGTLPRNVVALVEPLRKPAGQSAMKIDDSLTAADADKLLAAHTGHPHEVMLQLALLGLRRGEIGGLRWSAVNLDGDDPTITVRVSRVATPAGTVEQSSVKTASGARVLPIPEHLVPILRRHALAQREMRLAAGNLWQAKRISTSPRWSSDSHHHRARSTGGGSSHCSALASLTGGCTPAGTPLRVCSTSAVPAPPPSPRGLAMQTVGIWLWPCTCTVETELSRAQRHSSVRGRDTEGSE